MEFEAVIGLEVHARLRTATKMFCGCRAGFGDPPNSRTCPVCLGLPGALPVANARAVALALRLAVAVGGRVAPRSLFARKSYFYPDMPKNYQISQYERPLCEGGRVQLGEAGGGRAVALARIHLEEDAARSLHDAGPGGVTRLDFNRAGVPLLEIVTRPELRSGAEAGACLARLRQLVVALGVCDGSMEEGSLRCDANVSVRWAGETALGARVEIKNLNSIAGVRRAVDHEAARQVATVRAGGRVAPATRAWDADAGRTRLLRGKEEAPDYRYFPEPDLPPLEVTPADLEAARAALPELPVAREARLVREHGLAAAEAAALVDQPALADYFEAVARALGDGPAAGRWVLGPVLGTLHAAGLAASLFPVPAAELAALIARVRDGQISGTQARAVLAEMAATGATAAAIVARDGLRQESDAAPLAALVAGLLAAHPREVAAWRAGRPGVADFFVGQVMKATGGRANPALAGRLVREALAREG